MMTSLVLIAFLAGATLGQRCRVLVLLPAIAIVTPTAIGIEIVNGGSIGAIVLTTIASIASLQIGYLAGIGIRHLLAVARLRGLRIASIGAPIRRPLQSASR